MRSSETYTVDTIALLAYLADSLPRKADSIFSVAERRKHPYSPSITIGETLYILLRGKDIFSRRIPVESLIELLKALKFSKSLRVVDLDIDGWRIAIGSNLTELHDRMIVDTHLRHNSRAIIMNDEEIVSTPGVETIWE
ncbi:MAG: PIN domain-containing protein [Aigarchaeota archaeon]|nr:PIN domain-containing protein [Candidatus Pelearchaeum maunauluense]